MITVKPISTTTYTVSNKTGKCPVLTATATVRVAEELVVSVKDTSTPKPKLNFDRDRLNEKKIVIRESINRSEEELKSILWDKNSVDGDKVSLYLNGKLLLENYSLKLKKEVVLHLEPGSNLLLLEAVNEGREPPNTAAIGINNIYTNVTITSDMKTVGALEIIYTPVASN